MSTQVFPASLRANIFFPIKRTSEFYTSKLRSVSGKMTARSFQSQPIFKWDIPISLLRQGSLPSRGPWSEESTLQGFIEQMFGGFDTWLWDEQDDDSVLAQPILNTGNLTTNGDGTTLNFQLQRTRGGGTAIILGPNVVSAVYVNTVPVPPANYTVNNWGSALPGIISFGAGHAPGAGLPVMADFTYYFVVRFEMDEQEFQRFTVGRYEARSIKFASIV